MGEIAEMIILGVLCEQCGGYIDDDVPGYPRACEDCEKDDEL